MPGESRRLNLQNSTSCRFIPDFGLLPAKRCIEIHDFVKTNSNLNAWICLRGESEKSSVQSWLAWTSLCFLFEREADAAGLSGRLENNQSLALSRGKGGKKGLKCLNTETWVCFFSNRPYSVDVKEEKNNVLLHLRPSLLICLAYYCAVCSHHSVSASQPTGRWRSSRQVSRRGRGWHAETKASVTLDNFPGPEAH